MSNGDSIKSCVLGGTKSFCCTATDWISLSVLVSPVIGMIMLLGMIATSVGMICMFLKDLIMEKFYEQN